jgi:signal transduction histidine kinase
MQAMVKDLLAFSRVLKCEEDAEPAADSNAALSLALKNLQLAIQEKRAEITSDNLPRVGMSELHLVQVFQNLVGNSLKYSGNMQPRVHVSSTHRDGLCVFVVQDNGLGIPPEYRERVFGVFKRLHDRSYPGTGIGLALCKRIVEHYGCKIWIESEGGHGATFLFSVPAVEMKGEPLVQL